MGLNCPKAEAVQLWAYWQVVDVFDQEDEEASQKFPQVLLQQFYSSVT